jgi:hypothetical protein
MNKDLLIMMLAGIVGILFMAIQKVRSLRRRSENTVVDVSFIKFLHDEWDNFLYAFVALIGFIFLYDGATKTLPANVVPYVLSFSKFLFFFVGYMGGDFIMRILGRTEKIVNNEIDKVTKTKEDGTAVQ